MTPDDPEAPARARAARFRARLLGTVPMLTTVEVAERLGCSVAEVAAQVARDELLAVPTSEGLRLPMFQLADSGVLPGLPEVLAAVAAIPIRCEWVALDFLTASGATDDGSSILDLLRAGRVDEALDVAHHYGETGA